MVPSKEECVALLTLLFCGLAIITFYFWLWKETIFT